MSYGVLPGENLLPGGGENMVVADKTKPLDLKRHSKEYLRLEIGGHARSIGETKAYEDGLDGAISNFPMNMPEIVSKLTAQYIKDKNFPIMTLVVDDREADYVTRIEAFLDLLKGGRTCII